MTDTNQPHIHKILFLYWFILVIWQNIQNFTQLGAADVIVKTGLIIMLIIGFRGTHNIDSRNFGIFLVLTISMIITLCLEESNFTARLAIQYFYPLLAVFLVYCVGNRYEVTEEEYGQYLDWVIYVVLYMALYSLVFRTSNFTSALSTSNAYGSELSSFLLSNHEYGMYLLFGIAACFYRMSSSFKKRWLYLFALVLFFLNLILTFSRTSQLAAVAFIIIFLLFSKNYKLKLVTMIGVVVVGIIVISNSHVLNFISEIVIRADNNSDRFELWNYAIQSFCRSNLVNKIFGHGYGTTIVSQTGHTTVHNAYLQVLVTNGIVGLIFLVVCIVSSMITAIRMIKIDRQIGTYIAALVVSMIFLMFSNTAVVYYSSIDCAMMTFFCVVIPKYLYNYYSTRLDG